MHRYRRGMPSLVILEKDLGRVTGYKLNVSCVSAEKNSHQFQVAAKYSRPIGGSNYLTLSFYETLVPVLSINP